MADGPTANIDPAHQQAVIDLLLREECRRDGVAIVLVTHADEASQQFERVEHFEGLNRAAAT